MIFLTGILLFVVIFDLYVTGITVIPDKANTPLVIYLYTVLACTITLEGFKVVTRRSS